MKQRNREIKNREMKKLGSPLPKIGQRLRGNGEMPTFSFLCFSVFHFSVSNLCFKTKFAVFPNPPTFAPIMVGAPRAIKRETGVNPVLSP